MMLLVITFFINGEEAILDGWHPLELKSEAICETAKSRVEDYLDLLEVESYKVECIAVK